MKIKVFWTETARYETTIEVDGGIASSVTGDAVVDALDDAILDNKIDRDASCVEVSGREVDHWEAVQKDDKIPSAPQHEPEW